MQEDDRSALIAELEVGASYASLMSATSLFFTGILISQYKSFNPTIKVPLIYLIISTFSFIFAATIYSNAGSELTLNRLKAVEKYMIYAKNIVELLGLYLFILAVPLVIGAVTQDSFLRTTTIIVAIAGFAMYSQSKFSVLEKELTRWKKRYLSYCIIILALLLYFTQSRAVNHSRFLYSFISILLLVIILWSAAYFSLKSKQYKPVIVRAFVDSDAEALSRIIHRNVNNAERSHHHLPDMLGSLREHSTPAAIQRLAKDKQVFVAKFNNKVVGLACLEGNVVSMVFTDPSLHRKGVGRTLVEQAESEVFGNGYTHVEVHASRTEESFYRRLGYEGAKRTEDKDGSRRLVMTKEV
jgi:GNAT superfamily N-acetyltransferase